MAKPYKKHVEYSFEIGGEVILITDWDDDFVRVEEGRKNGQEDTHMAGCLVATTAGTFVWEEGEKMFIRYASKEFADAIRSYINTHGVPGKKAATLSEPTREES